MWEEAGNVHRTSCTYLNACSRAWSDPGRIFSSTTLSTTPLGALAKVCWHDVLFRQI